MRIHKKKHTICIRFSLKFLPLVQNGIRGLVLNDLSVNTQSYFSSTKAVEFVIFVILIYKQTFQIGSEISLLTFHVVVSFQRSHIRTHTKHSFFPEHLYYLSQIQTPQHITSELCTAYFLLPIRKLEIRIAD